MHLMILSDANVAAAKTALRSQLPGVRSSHLTEAIASGLQFNTHAALKAAIDANAELPSAIALASPADFERRLREFGYETSPSNPFSAVVSGRSLPDLPYAEFRRGDRVGNDSHYHYCQRLNRPMVMVRMARAYAELEWDCITVSPDQEDYLYGTDNGRTLGRLMFDKFQALAKGAPGKPLFLGGSFTGTVKKLLPDTARALAEEYFRLLYLPLREPRGPRGERLH